MLKQDRVLAIRTAHASEPPPLKESASARDRTKHGLKTRQGCQLYGLRKQTVEPVVGIIKSVMCFR